MLDEDTVGLLNLCKISPKTLDKLKLALGDEVFSEVKKRFLSLLQDHENLAELFFYAPVGYVVLDYEYKIKKMNRLGRILLDGDSSELTGLKFSEFVDSENADEFQYFMKNLKAGKSTGYFNLKLKNSSGRPVFISGTSGMEKEIENQSYKLVFFEKSADHPDSILTSAGNKVEATRKNLKRKDIVFHQTESDIDNILGNLTILVADDDEIARFYLSELLEKKCRKMFFAKNGKEALELFQRNSDIDLILMDIKMPVMDGYSATIKIKELDKKVIIVAQTAYALASDREKALAAGCDDYLAKPLLKKDLVLVVQKFFKKFNPDGV
jgi:CheY-like chemotaxis protein